MLNIARRALPLKNRAMLKKLLLIAVVGGMFMSAQAQIRFDASIDPDYFTDVVKVPSSPLKMQVLFIGGYDKVQTTATYGNPAGEATAKQWHDFIGFTPDQSGQSLGWISVNHEMVVADDNIGDGGGMTVFRVRRDANTDTLIIVDQTLEDGRKGKFFNVDFVNHTGETGMNCGGIVSTVDGRIWTAEEWRRNSNNDIADRDKSDFIIGQGTENGQAAPAGFQGFNGQKIQKYQNYNYMTEIDPRQAKAVRKQYNWGRQEFEGGVVMPDNKTVYLGVDATPGFFSKFVADEAGDFTKGKTYVYKHDATSKWIEIDNSDLNKMLNYADEAIAAGATMYNRLEWVAYDPVGGNVYLTETGRDNPGGSWRDEHGAGAVHAPHHLARAQAQGTHPDSSQYWDYYGRVLEYNVSTSEMKPYIEGGPYVEGRPSPGAYPSTHLTNPDGLGFIKIGEKSYMIIMEDINGTSFGRLPLNAPRAICEMFLLDMSISNPSIDDLVRIAVTPFGAEVTGACVTSDNKTLLFNVQHPDASNPFPYNNSVTIALTGWDYAETAGLLNPVKTGNEVFGIYPNPASRILYLNQLSDIAIYNAQGQRMNVYREVKSVDIAHLTPGVYFVVNQEGITKKLIVE